MVVLKTDNLQGNSFVEFYRAHVPYVRNLVFRMGIEAELDDAVQDCFVKAWRGLTAKDGSAFAGHAAPRTWLTRVAINTALDYLRRKKSDRIVATEEGHLDIPDHSARTTASEQLEASEIVKIILRSLKPESRAVLLLSAVEGFSMEEISEALDIPAGTVKSRLHTARKESLAELAKLGVHL